MKKSYKILALGISSLFFLGCSATPEVEYVRVTQFKALETKIEIIEADKKKLEEKYTSLENKFSDKKKGGIEEKIDIIEKSIENLQIDFLAIKEDFAENKQISAKQITEIDTALQSLEKIKDHYLENAINAVTLKNSAPEKINNNKKEINTEKKAKTPENSKKIIDLEAEAQKIRNSLKTKNKETEETENSSHSKDIKGEELEKLRMTFSEKKINKEKILFIFSRCTNTICQKYLVEKSLFSESMTIPTEKDSVFFISGTSQFLGEISGENYFQIIENFSVEGDQENTPKEGISPFELGGDITDKLSQ